MVEAHRKRMPRVGRTQLIREVSADLHMDEVHVERVIVEFLANMTSHLRRGESVSLSHDGLGRFDVVKAAPRVARNVRTGSSIHIPSRLRVRYVPTLDLKNIKGKKE